MKKINLPFFYQLGAKLNPLTEFTPTVNNRSQIWLASFPVHSYVYTLLETFKTLTVCRAAGIALIDAILKMQNWVREPPPDKWGEEDPSVDFLFQNVITATKNFEIVLTAELQRLETYHVTQKGIYSIPDLIDKTEDMLPDSTREKIGKKVVEEIRQSGRCLAFDNSTASGFHIIRALEVVMHDYYVFVCKPASKKRLDNWGEYISALHKLAEDANTKKSTREDVKKVIALLQQIKDQDRNLIMHPEVFLTPDDAHKLFEIAKSAIIAMTDTLPKRKKK